MPNLKISEEGKDLIKHYEGMRTKAYRCAANVLTIGYGHTKGVKPTDRITKAQADSLFDSDIIIFENAVNRLVTVDVSQNLFDSLVSFAFNLGEGTFARSTLLKYVNQKKDYPRIAAQFRRYIWGGGRKLSGLIRRREAEALHAAGLPWKTDATITDQSERDEAINTNIEPEWIRYEDSHPTKNNTVVGSSVAAVGTVVSAIISNAESYSGSLKEAANELSGYVHYLPIVQNVITVVMLASLAFVIVNRVKKILESRA